MRWHPPPCARQGGLNGPTRVITYGSYTIILFQCFSIKARAGPLGSRDECKFALDMRVLQAPIEITNQYCTTRSSTFTFIYCIHFEIAQFDCLNTGFLSEPILFSSSLSEGEEDKGQNMTSARWFDCLARGTISSDQYKLIKIFIFRVGWRPWQVELLLDIITAVQTFCPWRHFRLAYAML